MGCSISERNVESYDHGSLIITDIKDNIPVERIQLGTYDAIPQQNVLQHARRLSESSNKRIPPFYHTNMKNNTSKVVGYHTIIFSIALQNVPVMQWQTSYIYLVVM